MNIVILGGLGFVGSAVVKGLRDARKMHRVHVLNRAYPVEQKALLALRASELTEVDAVICCVGHCPPGGFGHEVATPLSTFPEDRMLNELRMHVLGPLNIFQVFMESHRPKHFVFMSSAAIRLLDMPQEKRPPIHIYHHLAAIVAENALIEGMRMDPLTTVNKTLIHKVSPAAISDSPFHNDPKALKSPTAVTRAEVVDTIIECINATEHQDRVVMRQPP